MMMAQKQESGPGARVLYGVPEGQDARVLAERARALAGNGGVLLHVAADDARAAALSNLLSFFAPDVAVVYFPAWDCLPYDRVSPHGELTAQRIAALASLCAWGEEARRYPRLLLTTVNALSQRVMPRAALAKSVLRAEKGGVLNPDMLRGFLAESGYARVDTVREPGEYAIRGGIVDLFPPGREAPLRIDLFGEEIESIRAFDPASQRTEGDVDSFALYPAAEFSLGEDSVARFRSAYREMAGVPRGDDPLYEAVSAGRRLAGMDHWLPLFYEGLETLFDYAPGAALCMDMNAVQARADRLAQIRDFYQARQTMESQAAERRKSAAFSGAVYHPVPVETLFIGEEEWEDATAQADALSPFGAPPEGQDGGGRRGRDFGDVRALPDGDLFGAVAAHVSLLRSEGRRILIAACSSGSRERLRTLLGAAGLANFCDVDGAPDLKKLTVRDTGMAVLDIDHGFTAPDLAVIAEQDILGDRLARRARKSRRAENFLTEVSSLSPGDLVVHVQHGIGRFEGLEMMTAAGKPHDFLKLVYDGGDRLFVPVENMEVLSRYGSDEGSVQLDRLGGAGWQARKAKARRDLMIIADRLLKIAAARQMTDAEAFHIGSGIYEEFAAGFPYQETEDQLRCIGAVLEDLARPHPMDRLVCGDVGFGKTEVALRAACAVAMNGGQVAVAVPTTLLARQHFQTFAARFKGTGLRVAQLSRLVPAREAAQVKDGLADGTVHIVVGTHALFAKGVRFAHLGLMVVDEEQRFGVKQKERLKEMKAGVHVLTLTATPIPRTLQMALSGVRELSLIATPPVDRLAIRTFVMPYDPVVIREAILREHHRGGQSFYVCPRIADMAELEERLRELVPEIKIVAAHGQMTPGELEDRMTAFYDRQYDLLLSTNIIESGIDIPSANTMIVHRADMFGLSQLYQIRGRIGRSKVRAYAYLTCDPGRKLTEQSQRRLEVIETLDSLGAGFQLASHDMDIRGAGNLLGEEQSGHIREIGVELYQQMLEEAVAAVRDGGLPEEAEDGWSPQINLGVSVLIPDRYVGDLTVRMSLYRRLAGLETQQDIEGFAAEMIDRFGPVPEEVENLLQIVAIKQFCRRAGVDKVDAGPKGVVFGFHKDDPPDFDGLMRWIGGKGGAIKLRPDRKLVVIRQWSNAAQRVSGVRGLMKELAALAPEMGTV